MDYTVYGYAIVPILIGILEVLKKIGVPTSIIPIISVLIGLSVGVATNLDNMSNGVVLGVVYGLSACGLYDSFKAVKKVTE